MNKRFVRNPRNISSIRSFLFSRTTIEPSPVFLTNGSSANIDTPVIASTSSRFSILYFNRS